MGKSESKGVVFDDAEWDSYSVFWWIMNHI